jgi:hypothetical protein
MAIIIILNTDREFTDDEKAQLNAFTTYALSAKTFNGTFASSSTNLPRTDIAILNTSRDANELLRLVDSFTPPIISAEVKTI